MKTAEIRQRFIDYFVRQGHTHVPSSSLVPSEDPTLLFTNAGMVQFKATFLGQESRPYKRATSVQRCLRAGGKHNDLEQVGETTRHHTFFEMLGNFSFGDYFKREAISYGWEFCTGELGLEPGRIWATIHDSDDEAFELWQEVTGIPAARIKRFGEDNFWQMADTGPCGPSSEIHYDLRSKRAKKKLSEEEFVALGEAGAILEIWNLVFMQFNRDDDGVLQPLPKPSIDTGAGLERIAAVMQGVDSNFHTDLFMPIIRRAEEVVGRTYVADDPSGVSFRVLADHARAVSFLIADGVFPTNEGRGYVLRRILRRAGRHAWLLGSREPTLYELCDEVAALMGDVYPELVDRRDHILRTARDEEERFMTTVDAGMARFDELAPPGGSGTIVGADAFKLYDTYGFPLDLTELMARERGYEVDVEGFEESLDQQRRRSRDARQVAEVGGARLGVSALPPEAVWQSAPNAARNQEWVGYDDLIVHTELLAWARENGRVFLQLLRNPFYAEAGGQISDVGFVEGDGWRMSVDEVFSHDDRVVIAGPVEGEFVPSDVRAVVDPRRRDTQRNHTATHLLHAALRRVLGEHVTQAGSLVAPDRLRFDFTHTSPLTEHELDEVERLVNEQVWRNVEVSRDHASYRDAIARGAMALFGEKYTDVVRVVEVPGFSLELCGGCHVHSTGEIGSFIIVSETGSAAGVRRIEAVTGPRAYSWAKEHQEALNRLGRALKVPTSVIPQRVEALLGENRGLHEKLQVRVQRAAEHEVRRLVAEAKDVNGTSVASGTIELSGREMIPDFSDRLREGLGTGVGIVETRVGEKSSWVVVVTDDLIHRGVHADKVMDALNKVSGGTGGGRPHLAQGSTGPPEQTKRALEKVTEIVRPILEPASK